MKYRFLSKKIHIFECGTGKPGSGVLNEKIYIMGDCSSRPYVENFGRYNWGLLKTLWNFELSIGKWHTIQYILTARHPARRSNIHKCYPFVEKQLHFLGQIMLPGGWWAVEKSIIIIKKMHSRSGGQGQGSEASKMLVCGWRHKKKLKKKIIDNFVWRDRRTTQSTKLVCVGLLIYDKFENKVKLYFYNHHFR